MLKTCLKKRKSGVVIIIVIIAILMISLAIFGFAATMRTEYSAAINHGRQLRTENAAKSGIEIVKGIMRQSASARQEIDLSQFQFSDDASSEDGIQIAFAVPQVIAGSERRWSPGLENESSKINLRSLVMADAANEGFAKDALMKLPGMSEQAADGILDWIDADSNPRSDGAEENFYQEMLPAYQPRNGIPPLLEELILVNGVSRESLLGNQISFAGEPPEVEETAAETFADSSGAPWVRYLTVFSAERNESFDGAKRIFLNDDNISQLHQDINSALGIEWANYVVAMRQFGNGKPEGDSSNDSKQGKDVVPASSIQLDLTARGSTKIESMWDLVTSQVKITKGSKTQRVNPPISADSLAGIEDVFDRITLDSEPIIYGRINILTAPKEVLWAIPNMDMAIVERLIAARESIDGSAKHPSALAENNLIDLETMKKMEPFVTTRGEVVRGTSIGYSDNSRTISHLEFIIDGSTLSPRQIYCKEITDLGVARSILSN